MKNFINNKQYILLRRIKITIENTMAIKLSNKDSTRDCNISCGLCAPATFLIPISFDRSKDLAVERLI